MKFAATASIATILSALHFGNVVVEARASEKRIPTTDLSVRAMSSAESEKIDRIVDQAALEALRKAIQQIDRLLSKRRGTESESPLLMKLGDLRQQAAQLEFRIGQHSRNDQSHRRALLDAVSTFDEVLTRFPKNERVPQILSWRAQAHADLGNQKFAEKDYSELITRFPEAPEADSARMATASIYSDRGDHARALSVLEPIENKPESPFYPFALHQMAWAHFNRGENTPAITLCAQIVTHLRNQESRGALTSSDAALIENALLDASTFQADAIEKSSPPPPATEILESFLKLNPGEKIGGMSLRLAKLLRAHEQTETLAGWSQLLWKKYGAVPFVVEVDLLLREHAYLKHQWKDLVAPFSVTAQGAEWEAHRKLFSKAAEEIHALLAKNSRAPREQTQPWLEKLGLNYQRFLEITDTQDARSLQARLNLAQAFLQLQQKKEAIAIFRRVVDTNSFSNPAVIQASFLSIKAQLEVLTETQVFPTKLPLLRDEVTNSLSAASKIDPRLIEVLTWIEAHLSHLKVSDHESLLRFERAKIIYLQGKKVEALRSLNEVIDKFPESNDSAGVLALILDTHFFSKDDAALQGVLKKMEHNQRLQANEGAVKIFSAARLQWDGLILTRDSQDTEQKIEAATRILQSREASPEIQDLALLYQARVARNSDRDGEALSLLERLSHPEKQQASLVLMAYAIDDGKRLTKTLQQFCDSKDPLCRQMQEWHASTTAGSLPGITLEAQLKRALHASSSARLFQAATLLSKYEKLGYRDRNGLLRMASQGWNELLPLLQWELLPVLTQKMPQVLARNRQQIRIQAPISKTQKTEAHVIHRMDILKEFDNAVTAVASIPVMEIQLAALQEQAAALAEFADDLASLGDEAGNIRAQVQKQAQTLHTMAQERAGQMTSAVQEAELFAKTNVFLTKNNMLSRSARARFFQDAHTMSESDQARTLGWILWNSGARAGAGEVWKKVAPAVQTVQSAPTESSREN